jgi:hypothetical protein
MLELLFNPGRAVEMAQNAIGKIKNVYNWEIISQQIAGLYKDVIENKQ